MCVRVNATLNIWLQGFRGKGLPGSSACHNVLDDRRPRGGGRFAHLFGWQRHH